MKNRKTNNFLTDFTLCGFNEGEGDQLFGSNIHPLSLQNRLTFWASFYASGEIAPATAFMTGKIKISGDLSKALTLEKVMVAAREAKEKKWTMKT